MPTMKEDFDGSGVQRLYVNVDSGKIYEVKAISTMGCDLRLVGPPKYAAHLGNEEVTIDRYFILDEGPNLDPAEQRSAMNRYERLE